MKSMKYQKLWIIGITICILLGLLGFVGYRYAQLFNIGNSTVEIIQDSKVIREVDLSGVKETEIIKVEYEGHYNIIEIEPKGIHIKEADCPDKTCVKMGYLKENALPIVCLPHRLMIKYANSDE